jgi:magnesium-transporting ATPase (P-type)
MVVCKGADSIIEKRLRPGQSCLEPTKAFLEDYAKEGLRTLLIAYKYVDETFYQNWNKKYQAALILTKGKEKTINNLAEEIELNFELIGSTAIEDCL